MKKVTQIGFAEIFYFAKKKYGIHWNPCNDIFFGNALDYGTVSDFIYGEWQGLCDFWKDESSWEIKAADFTKEEVLAMSDIDKSYLITAAYLESIEFKGDEIQIDCR